MGNLTERFEMRLSLDDVNRLDKWRNQQPNLPSRAEAIRRLVSWALAEGVEISMQPVRQEPAQ